MQARLVLSEGEWISVSLPKGRDPSWTVADEYAFAAAYASAIRVFSEMRAVNTAEAHATATNVAEAIVLRRLYPGLVFDARLEQDIQSIVPQ
jgi:hypothetical protein